ncbi:hypothetical protein FQA39_LY11688 [Lamprigera yunnana]|nr:hypothetical protein FQA39_LY11688 [Lamprigera yunnana]
MKLVTILFIAFFAVLIQANVEKHAKILDQYESKIDELMANSKDETHKEQALNFFKAVEMCYVEVHNIRTITKEWLDRISKKHGFEKAVAM